MPSQTRISLLLSAALVLPGAAFAQDDVTTLQEVILSGGLTPVAEAGYGRAHTVIDAAEIAARGFATVQDALRAVPGLSLSSSGKSLTALRMRGSETSHVLVLVDGVKLAAGGDEYTLSGLETANIERIEVLRGPQSVYFGSNASAGVVNIITRKGEEGLHYGGAVEAGNGWGASAFVSQRGAQGGLFLGLAARDDRGFDVSDDAGGDKDGIDRRTLTFSGDYALSEDLTVGFAVRRSDETYGFDATGGYWDPVLNMWIDPADEAGYLVDSNDTSDRKETSGLVFAEYAMLEGRLTHRLSWQQSKLDQRFNNPMNSNSIGHSEALKYRASFGLDGAVDGADHVISLMIDRQRDTNTLQPGLDRESTSYAAEYRGRFDALSVQGGLRHDDNSVFPSANTWTAALSYDLNESLRLHVSAGKGVVNPAYAELYGGFGQVGNLGLNPEVNRGYDLGIEASFLDGRAVADLTYFNERLQDEITWTGVPGPDGSNYFNQTGRSTREGVELSGRFEATETLALGLSYTYLDARNPDASRELRRPRHELGLTAGLQTFGGRGNLGLDLRYVAGNWDTQYYGAYATAKLPDYWLANVSASYDVTDTLRLTGRVNNLFDKDYREVWGYATEGRTAWLGLEAKW
ncbi:TonB-dependent receptor plug domain-containing protein [Gemmobacter serpentinus]|uniref:TonB-dependent receptor plug domain-containing protein n=1 Tax=Gemmobacter serpentinus TaxID=2652247 RepID=UPI00124E7DA4|nr:TonB-dependent receptor [Gemmobacter serpentinus]